MLLFLCAVPEPSEQTNRSLNVSRNVGSEECLLFSMFSFKIRSDLYESCACTRVSIRVFRMFSDLGEVMSVGEGDSLVVQDHVRQPDVFGGQPDFQHPVKFLRGPSQPVVLPLLRAKK